MNFTSLRYFITVAEELNVSRAAEKLFMSQQSLSSHINRLEAELNTRLFDRNPRLSLTYAGTRVLRISEQILSLERQIHVELDDIANERTGTLSIGLTRYRARTILPLVLPTYSTLYPGVELHTVITDNRELHEKLLSGELDLIICNDPPPAENTESIPLLKDKFCVVVPKKIMQMKYPDTYENAITAYQKGYPLDGGFFENIPTLLSVGTHVRQATDRYFHQLNVTPNVVMETNDIETLFGLCEEGMGITFSYADYAQRCYSLERHDLRNFGICIFPIEDATLAGNIKINYRSDRYLNYAGRRFIEIAIEQISGHSGQ